MFKKFIFLFAIFLSNSLFASDYSNDDLIAEYSSNNSTAQYITVTCKDMRDITKFLITFFKQMDLSIGLDIINTLYYYDPHHNIITIFLKKPYPARILEKEIIRIITLSQMGETIECSFYTN